MDIDMDIDYDVSVPPFAQPAQQVADAPTDDAPMPAAYYEDLSGRPTRQVEPWTDTLNLQGVDNFDPNDAIYYLVEYGVLQQKIKLQRWVNDSSLNLQFYSAEDAAVVLQLLTHPEAGDPDSIPPETARRAKPWKDRELIIRQANSGDQKVRGAASQSKYYERNPDVRGGDRRGDRGREREPRRRQPPRRDYLDYGDEEPARDTGRSRSGDEQMRDGSDFDNRRNRRNFRERNGREGDGRLRAADVDSYRPGSKSPRESRFGRLRGRSASPVSGGEGDGRFGFAEQGTSTHRQYRSRSRSRENRRRREPSVERWTHDRANYDREGDASGGRWAKDTSTICRHNIISLRKHFDSYEQARYGDAFSNTSNHRRSDAFDESAKGSLLSRMTKDGQPVAPQGRSLASRITHDDDDSSYGRLKGDDSAPRYKDFSEPARKRGLADRITRDDDNEGINIRGSASQSGFSIRGVAGGL